MKYVEFTLKVGDKKMRIMWTLVSIFICTASVLLAQTENSPYIGLEIKSLSQQEIKGYLSGKGMGFAKAAELNHYPGPKHVLELAKELQISKQQINQTKKVYDTMNEEALQLGKLYIEKENELNRLFNKQKIGEKQLKSLILEIGRLRGELRFVHINAHLKMKNILTKEQIDNYDKLRGYTTMNGQLKQDYHQGKE